MYPIFFFFGVILSLNCLSDTINQIHSLEKRHDWGYEENNPMNWYSLQQENKVCKSGKNQSPINFQDKAMKSNKPHVLRWPDRLQSGEWINNGHTLQVNVKRDSIFSLQANGKETQYDLVQFHLHIPSEHHRYKKNFAMEMHFVHVSKEKEIAVYGIWFKLAQTSCSFITNLVQHGIPKQNQTIPIKRLDFTWLKKQLNKVRSHWSYSGSLTTPPCSENVQWSIPDAAYPISWKDYQMLHDAMPFNARPTQPQPKGQPTIQDDLVKNQESKTVESKKTRNKIDDQDDIIDEEYDFQGYDFHDKYFQ